MGREGGEWRSQCVREGGREGEVRGSDEGITEEEQLEKRSEGMGITKIEYSKRAKQTNAFRSIIGPSYICDMC